MKAHFSYTQMSIENRNIWRTKLCIEDFQFSLPEGFRLQLSASIVLLEIKYEVHVYIINSISYKYIFNDCSYNNSETNLKFWAS